MTKPSRPLHDMLCAAASRASWHMPGHKGRGPFDASGWMALDTTELPVTDDLYQPAGAIAEAQRLYAEAAGAEASLFLHNGATAGVHALLQLWARPGDRVLLPRNAHLSAVNACILGGLLPLWMPVETTLDGYAYLPEETVLAALAAHPEAKALLLTRPDYFGGCIPLERIVPAARAMGVRVVVDEAHGAHLPWLGQPASVGALGADAWVQSVHKTLPGLTGSAVLHLRREADRGPALRILRREQTSSPSFLLLQSIDDARAYMQGEGKTALAQTVTALRALRECLPRWGYRDAHGLWTETGYAFDPTRLVVDAPQGGEALARALASNGMDVECWDDRRVVCIATCRDTPAEIGRLGEALAAIPPQSGISAEALPAWELPPIRLSPREAALAEGEWVSLTAAVGRIAAQSAGLYPPGIPLVCPGEEITQAVAQTLCGAARSRRFGTEGDLIWCVKPSSLTWMEP